jgi:hypothetical protein
MKRNIFIIFTVFLMFTTSCEKNLGELNLDPTRLTEVDLRLMLPEIITQSMYSEAGTGGRAIGIVMQQLFGLDAQQLAYNDYIMGEDLMNNYWRTGLYAGALRSSDVMIKQATEEEATFYVGVGKIIMANQYGIATSWFGDIPFSDALKGTESLKPLYDSQQSVYAGVIAMLDEAIGILGSATGYGGGDLIYDGDASLWIKTAKGLKARFLMHQAKRSSGNYAAALSEIASSYASSSEQSIFTFGTALTQNYPLAKFGIGRPGTLGFHPQFASMLEGDPRKDLFYKEDGGNLLYYDPAFPFTRNDASVPMISFAELKFMEAEAQFAAGSDASAALKAGIMASMELSGADMAAGAEYADAVIAGGVDLETIITEAYKGYYGHAFGTTWSNYRRTGFPVLTPSSNGVNGLNPSGVIPQRFLYVESETQTNRDNVAAARAAQGGGLLDAKLWVFE